MDFNIAMALRATEEALDKGIFSNKYTMLDYFNCRTDDSTAVDCDECPLRDTCHTLSYNENKRENDYDLFIKNFDALLKEPLKDKYGRS